MPIVSREVEVSPDLKVGGSKSFFLIGGPCVIESGDHAAFMAREIKAVCSRLRIPYIFKASYDKANRSSRASFRGPGLDEGLRILKAIKDELGLPVLSDVHETGQVEKAAEVLDVIQIPAFLCRQTDLVMEAAATKKAVNLKKGQFISPAEMKNVLDKALSRGNDRILLTERGTAFGYNNLVFDIRSIPQMKTWGFPVVIDASHIVQRPGLEGSASGGESEFIPYMAKAGIAVGADGLFLEIHNNPSEALSDRNNSLILNKLEGLLRSLLLFRKARDEGDEQAG